MGIKKFFNPSIFQGEWKHKNYFEEWLFKISDSTNNNSFLIIPGVSLGKNKENFYIFIQIIDIKIQTQYFEKFEIKDFIYSAENFNIKIGDNIFSEHGITLKTNNFKGRINFRNFIKWPISIFGRNHNIKNIFPFFKNYYSIISMYSSIAGSLNINGETIDFTGGKVYLEKKWGKTNPNSFIWAMCNTFEVEKNSISLFISQNNFFINLKKEYLCSFYFNGKHNIFSSSNGSKLIKLNISENNLDISFAKKNQLLELFIELDHSSSIPITLDKQNNYTLPLSTTSKIYIKYYQNSKLIFSGQGTKCLINKNGNIN